MNRWKKIANGIENKLGTGFKHMTYSDPTPLDIVASFPLIPPFSPWRVCFWINPVDKMMSNTSFIEIRSYTIK